MIGDRWGVSDVETRRPYPCDSLVASPELQAWRGVRVNAPPAAVGGRRVGRIVSVEPGVQLTASIMGAYVSYVLVPQKYAATRLLFKVVMRTARLLAPGLSLGDLVMARRQLLNLKRLAERHHGRGVPPGATRRR
jgi:hypothetical protein